VESHAPCPACGGRLVAWRSATPADPAFADVRFALARCASCGTAVTLGDAPAALYEAGAYRPGPPRMYATAEPLLRRFDRRRLELVGSLAPPPARLLDAGAGRGRFVSSARAAGYDASGIEPSPHAGEAARGAPVEQVGIADARIGPSSVDVVTLWHVLEHLDDPGAALDRVREWLAPSGGLVIGVPNLDSLQAHLGGQRWYHLDVPRHRVHFTTTGLCALLEAHRFSVEEVRHALLEHNPYGMWQTLVNHLTRRPSYLYNALKRNAPLRSRDMALTVAALPLLPLAAALELAAGAAGKGGTIAVLARRVD
jgi:SAM-dependent methyltransferase